MRCSER